MSLEGSHLLREIKTSWEISKHVGQKVQNIPYLVLVK